MENVEIIRSRRKTLCIEIRQEQVLVRAPCVFPMQRSPVFFRKSSPGLKVILQKPGPGRKQSSMFRC